MKSFLKGFKESRLGQYLIYGLIYVIFWKFAGFEVTVIIIGSTILGEIHYRFNQRSKF
jgi:hypothetical protein